MNGLDDKINATEEIDPPEDEATSSRWIEKEYPGSISMIKGAPIAIYNISDRVYQVKITAC